MTFDEAITAVSEQPGLCLTGLTLDGRGDCLTVYFLCSTSEAQIELTCERAQLFSSRREAIEYELDSAPTEAMLVEYTEHSDVLGGNSRGEHSLHALFPELPCPEESVAEEFKAMAVQAAEASEFITVV